MTNEIPKNIYKSMRKCEPVTGVLQTRTEVYVTHEIKAEVSETGKNYCRYVTADSYLLYEQLMDILWVNI